MTLTHHSQTLHTFIYQWLLHYIFFVEANIEPPHWKKLSWLKCMRLWGFQFIHKYFCLNIILIITIEKIRAANMISLVFLQMWEPSKNSSPGEDNEHHDPSPHDEERKPGLEEPTATEREKRERSHQEKKNTCIENKRGHCFLSRD